MKPSLFTASVNRIKRHNTSVLFSNNIQEATNQNHVISIKPKSISLVVRRIRPDTDP